MSTDLVVARGQQLVGVLLSTVPLAERMLLYNVALTAWTRDSSPKLTPGSLTHKSLPKNH
jgi:hypothetical protein